MMPLMMLDKRTPRSATNATAIANRKAGPLITLPVVVKPCGPMANGALVNEGGTAAPHCVSSETK